jgi:hypothetical protein
VAKDVVVKAGVSLRKHEDLSNMVSQHSSNKKRKKDDDKVQVLVFFK